jgi:hypothetical protein
MAHFGAFAGDFQHFFMAGLGEFPGHGQALFRDSGHVARGVLPRTHGGGNLKDAEVSRYDTVPSTTPCVADKTQQLKTAQRGPSGEIQQPVSHGSTLPVLKLRFPIRSWLLCSYSNEASKLP